MRTIDLFCGAGGITQGFRQAGFNCLYANDIDSHAVDTFKLNHPDTWVEAGPIEDRDPAKIRKSFALRKGDLECLVGGPPCQGFSIYAHGRLLDDPRNSMFRHYLRFVDEFAPQTILLENVPGMLSLGSGKVCEAILGELETRGYKTSVRILLAAHHGVPQTRWRLIFLASQRSGLSHPGPTHFCESRANFTGGATLTTRVQPLDALRLRPAIVLRDAIGDLPDLGPGDGAEVSTYNGKMPKSDFAKAMRGEMRQLFNHTSNRITRINLERLRHIPPGGSWTDIPHDLLPAGMKRARRSDHTKRYGRLTWDSLATTVLTKCDPHWGAVFHPDQPRTFTVREAARIQSFPDRYRFLGPRVSQYEQVGNAVPVLLAAAIAGMIRDHLNSPRPQAHTP
jgi:DNA (cytosine-5)-methyltransferase 1